MIVIGSLRPDDWQLWRELRLQALADAPGAFGSRLAEWQDADESHWRARLQVADTVNVVALLDDRPVGMASGMPEHVLQSMWVHPDGRGHGVGDRLIQSIAQWARDRGARRLTLSVVSGNAAAQSLYERNGFLTTDEVGDLLPNGVTREIVMAKPL